MLRWIKTSLPAFAAAVIGAIVTVMMPKIFDPAVSNLYPSVTVKHVEVPTFSRILGKGDEELLAPLVPRLSGTAREVLRIMVDADRAAHLNVFEIKIVNSTPRRTKGVEVAFEKGVFAIISGDQPNKSADRCVDISHVSSVGLNTLNPGESATVIIASTATYIGWGSTIPIKVLVEDRLVELQPLVIGPSDTLLLWANRNWPDGGIILQLAVWALALILVLFFAFFVFAWATRNNFALLSRMYSKVDKDRVHRFSDYMRANTSSKDDVTEQ